MPLPEPGARSLEAPCESLQAGLELVLPLHRVAGIMTMQRQKLGKSGEDLAVQELERRGYAILARRYRTRYGEIDVVSRDGETTVFVEVKARTSDEFGGAAEAVTPWKQRRLVSMATDYLVRHRLGDRPCRFDIVAVDRAGEAGREVRVTVYTNAFDA